MEKRKPIEITRNEGWKELSGDLPVKMTNDYLFRALMQTDNETLQALIASLLDVDRSEISEAKIENPILLGETLTDKQFVLDTKVMLNHSSNLNIEMQVVHEEGWIERSVSYLARMFDDLNRGQNYADAKTAIHIGILDFTLFEDEPVFYSVNMLTNQKTGKVYTEKFQLRYVDLTRIDLASAEDKQRHLDQWAQMFKATTWEELQMLAAKNQDIDNAVSYVYPLTEEKELREQMIRRQEFLATMEGKERRYHEALQQIQEQAEQIQEKNEQLQEQAEQIQEKDEQLQEQADQIQEKDNEIAKLRQEIAQYRISK